jgi:DNA-binding transcriptional ArsR family regulator
MANLDRAFQALADPTRRAVVARLTSGPASVSELAPANMALPSFLQHLKMLEQAGLVRSEKQGRVRTCHIEGATLRNVEDWMRQRRREWENRLDRLSEFLANEDGDEK